MALDPLQPSLHSEQYFGDTRDFWWHVDFLALMARRWRLDEVHAMLDVGCGLGHWGRLLRPLLAPDARVWGIDPEPEWVTQAAERADQPGAYTYGTASADALPFPDDTFDMVTCQTVLIHVPDLAAALREMHRVLRPGGLLAVAEPNNLAHAGGAAFYLISGRKARR